MERVYYWIDARCRDGVQRASSSFVLRAEAADPAISE